jgi:hypothetical protein
MALFKINGTMDELIQVLQLFLQKYRSLTGREEWEDLSEDVEFIGPVYKTPLLSLKYQLDEHVQHETCMSVTTTNRGHHTAKGILVGGGAGWK